MRFEKGYFCSVIDLASYFKEEVWFGPKVNPDLDRMYENLVSNGLKLFPKRKSAKLVLEELTKNPVFKESALGFMSLQIAESKDERQDFQNTKRLVILHTTDLGTRLIGPNVSENDRSSIYPVEGELLTVNGGISFDHYPSYTLSETGRQGGKVTLARLISLRKIPV